MWDDCLPYSNVALSDSPFADFPLYEHLFEDLEGEEDPNSTEAALEFNENHENDDHLQEQEQICRN